jgi:hypothetical protein
MIWDWAATVLDACLALPRAGSRLRGSRLLRRAWRALPGDLLGLFVMRASGIAWPTREIQAGDVRALLVEDGRVDRYFSLHLIPVQAQTLGCYVFARGPIPPETLAHEVEHIRQWRRFGPLYLPAYFAASVVALFGSGHPYADNWFEVAARRRAQRDVADTPPGDAT